MPEGNRFAKYLRPQEDVGRFTVGTRVDETEGRNRFAKYVQPAPAAPERFAAGADPAPPPIEGRFVDTRGRRDPRMDLAFAGQPAAIVPRQMPRAPVPQTPAPAAQPPEAMATEQGVDASIGRARTALSSFGRGIADVAAGVPKGVAIDLEQGYRSMLRAFDRIDQEGPRSERPIYSLDGRGEVPAPHAHNLEAYRQADADGRAALRQKYAAADPRDSGLYKAGQWISDSVKDALPINPEYAEEFLASKIPQGLGSAVGFLALGVGGRAMGAPAMAMPAGAGSALGASGQFEEALKHGASMEDAFRASNLGAVIGMSEALPIGRLLDRLDAGTGGSIKKLVREAIKQGTEEAAQETFQTIAGNLIAAELVQYDPERGWFDGSGEAAGVGFSVGALMQTIGGLILPGGRRGANQAPPASPEQPTQAPPTAAQTPSAPAADFTPGQSIRVVDPGGWLHGAKGTVVEAGENAVTVRSNGQEFRVGHNLIEALPEADMPPTPVERPTPPAPPATHDPGTAPTTPPPPPPPQQEQPPPRTTREEPAPPRPGLEPVYEEADGGGVNVDRQVGWVDPETQAFTPLSAPEPSRIPGQLPAASTTPPPAETQPDQAVVADQQQAPAPESAAQVSRPTASWVIRDRATGEVVMKTFDRRAVDALNTAKYEAVPIQEHLAGVNRDIRQQQAPAAASVAVENRDTAATAEPILQNVPQQDQQVVPAPVQASAPAVTAPAPPQRTPSPARGAPTPLMQFIRNRGGIDPADPNVADLRAILDTAAFRLLGRPATARTGKGGLGLDYIREAAVEAGYLPEGATINDLLDAIRQDARAQAEGRGRVYAAEDMGTAVDMERRQREQQDEDRAINRFGNLDIAAAYEGTRAELEGLIQDARARLAAEDAEVDRLTREGRELQATKAEDARDEDAIPFDFTTDQPDVGAGTPAVEAPTAPAARVASEEPGAGSTGEVRRGDREGRSDRGRAGPDARGVEPGEVAKDAALLAGFPAGSRFIESKVQTSRGRWAVAGPDGQPIWNYEATKEDAAKATRERLNNIAEIERKSAERADREREIAERLRAGGEPTDADLKFLDLKPSARFEYLSPVVQRLFGISRARARIAMGDALRKATSDMGAAIWYGNSRKALMNAAAYGQPPLATERTDQGEVAAERRPLSEETARRAFRSLANEQMRTELLSFELFDRNAYYSHLRPIGAGFPIQGQPFDRAGLRRAVDPDRVLVTDNPVSVTQIVALDLLPATPPARLALVKEAYAAIPGSKPGRYILLDPKQRDRGYGAAVTRSAKGGVAQLTFFDRNGFSGDQQHKSIDEALTNAIGMGFVEPAPEALNDLLQSAEFRQGNERSTAAARRTERTDQGDNFVLGDDIAGEVTGADRKAAAERQKRADIEKEMAVKARQQKLRRGGQRSVDDLGMFNRQTDLVDMAGKARPAADTKPASNTPDPAGFVDMWQEFADRVAGVDGLEARAAVAAEWVLEQASETRFEYIVVLDGNGRVVQASTSNRDDGVGFGGATMDRQRSADSAMVMVHNHPSGGSLSSKDIAMLAQPGIREVRAVTLGGKIQPSPAAYRARMEVALPPGMEWTRFHGIIRRIEAMLTTVGEGAIHRGEISVDQANEHFHSALNSLLHRAGVITYETTWPPDVLPTVYLNALDALAPKVKARLRLDKISTTERKPDGDTTDHILNRLPAALRPRRRVGQVRGGDKETAGRRDRGQDGDGASPRVPGESGPSGLTDPRIRYQRASAARADTFTDAVYGTPTADGEKARAAVVKLLNRITPGAGVETPTSMTDGTHRVLGAVANGFIHIALDGPNLANTARHEAIHWLRRRGLISAADWRALEKAARDGGWVEKYNIAGRYPELTAEQRIEEAIAEAYADWNAGGMTAQNRARRAMLVLKRLFERVRAAIRRALGREPDFRDLFATIESGRTGRQMPGVSGEIAGDQQRGERITDTPAFRRWFGDSKVVDAKGEPLRVYHGTNADFESFSATAGGRETGSVDARGGFFFSSDPDVAASYTDFYDPYLAKIGDGPLARIYRDLNEKLLGLMRMGSAVTSGGRIMPVYLSIQNPFVIDQRGRRYSEAEFGDAILAAKEAGHDGVVIKNVADDYQGRGATSDVFVPFRPEQIKSATGNRGTFDPADPRIRYQRASDPRRLGEMEIVVPSRTVYDVLLDANKPLTAALRESVSMDVVSASIERARIALQDKMLRLRSTQREIERLTGKKLTEAEDAYLQEEMYTGRVGARLDEISAEHKEPLVRAIVASPLNDASIQIPTADGTETVSGAGILEAWLYARHAPERNAQIASINPDFPDGGSGMTNAHAAQITKAVEGAGLTAHTQHLADMVDTLLADGLDRRVEYGLMSAQDAAKWRDTYKHYVPLRGIQELDGEADGPKVGQGYSVRGPESKRALGRSSRATDILANAFVIADEAIIRGEKNRVFKAFHNLVSNNPDPNLWELSPVRMAYVISKSTGLVERRPVTMPTAEQDRRTLRGKIDGKEVRIEIHDPLLAAAMKSIGADGLNALMRPLAAINRYLSTVNTGLNPDFVVSNGLRDFQTAMIQAGRHDMDGLVTDIMKTYKDALAGTYGGIKGKRDTKWQKIYGDYVKVGGKVSFWRMDDINDHKQAFAAAMADANPSNLRKLKKAAAGVLKFVEDANIAVDNGVRLAAFEAARKRGMSDAKAASLAKNLTVNFNRRGTLGPAMNALFMFYNAGMQGTAILMSGLRHKRVRRAAAGIAIAGFLVEMLNAALSPEDDDGDLLYDKIGGSRDSADFLKSRNMVFVDPTGTFKDGYLTIPLLYGYNVFWDLGRNIAAYARGGQGGAKAIGNILRTAVDMFNPIGTGRDWIATILPTVLKPGYELTVNENFMGNRIYPEPFPFDPAPTPSSAQPYRSTSTISKEAAAWLNSLTGGDNVVPGTIDIPPQAIDHLGAWAFGGMGRFWGGLADVTARAGNAALTDAPFEWSTYDIPFARKVVRPMSEFRPARDAREAIGEIRRAHGEHRNYIKGGEHDRAAAYLEENRPLIVLNKLATSTAKELSDIRKRRYSLDEKIPSDDPRILELKAREARVISTLAERYKEAMREMGRGNITDAAVRAQAFDRVVRQTVRPQ